MFAAILATAVATPLVALASWRVFRLLTATPAPTGRHRLTATGEQYRPRPTTPKPSRPVVVPVIPGPDPVLTDKERRARMIAVPLPPRQQAPLTDDVRELMNALAADIESGALDEQTREVARIQ